MDTTSSWSTWCFSSFGRPGTRGEDADDSILYDELVIEHNEGEVEIVVYNRAILLFRTDDEALRRIHQVCCPLENLGARRSLA